MKKLEISTPALIVDLDLFERNVKKMADFFADKPAKLRPHFKAHRCPEISRIQMRAGAIGITCAKLGEAEHLADLGFDHLLVANQIAGGEKIERLAKLCKNGVDAIVAVDSLALARAMDLVGRKRRTRLNVLLEVNIGMNRCGLPVGEELRKLACFCALARGLRLRGIMGYEGHLVGKPQSVEKERQVRTALAILTGFADELRSRGIPIEIVSSGGTGTYWITGAYPGITEVQAGSYCVMDPYFLRAGAKFDLASIVLVTIISRPSKALAIGDAGLKSFHPALGMPLVKTIRGATVQNLNAEHCYIKLSPAADRPKVGDKIEMYVPYVDGTFNLYDKIYAVRKDKVEKIWPTTGRGRSN